MDEQQYQRTLASYQYEQEFFKHFTTLSTGSIVLIVTFLEKLFSNPEAKTLVGVSLIAFCLSVIGTLALQLSAILRVDSEGFGKPMEKLRLAGLLIFLSFGGFLIGLSTLVVFALINLY